MAKEIEPRRRPKNIKLLDGNNLATQEQCDSQIKYYCGKDYEAIEKARLEKMMREFVGY